MAKFVLTNASVTVNSVNLSAYASSVTITTEADDVDVTSFGAVNKEHAKGIADASIEVEFFQDFAVAAVDATLWPLVGSTATVPIVIKPTTAAVSATNPSFTMQGLLMNYSPLDGSVGDAASTSVTFQNGSQTGIVRATA